jgi:hypothetical protein
LKNRNDERELTETEKEIVNHKTKKRAVTVVTTPFGTGAERVGFEPTVRF